MLLLFCGRTDEKMLLDRLVGWQGRLLKLLQQVNMDTLINLSGIKIS